MQQMLCLRKYFGVHFTIHVNYIDIGCKLESLHQSCAFATSSTEPALSLYHKTPVKKLSIALESNGRLIKVSRKALYAQV